VVFKQIAAVLLVLLPATAVAQLQVARINGVLSDPSSQPIAAAEVVITDPAGTQVARATTGSDGRFRFDDIAPGSYTVRVSAGTAQLLAQPIVVRGGLPIELALKAQPRLHEDVVVHGDASANAAERPHTIAGDAVRSVAEPIPSQRVQAALATLPGWSAEDNGLLHVRGADDGFLYVQDGIPVYERLDRLFGLPPSPAAIDSMHVMNGYVPPEYGFKAGAVVVVRSSTGIRSNWNGTIDAGVADIDTRHVQGIGAGPVGNSAALMFTASDERSSRFLDPVELANYHNEGRSTSAAAQFTWARDARIFTGSVQGGRNHYDVPNNEEQDEAGQDQRQRTEQLLYSASWQNAVSQRTVWQISAYGRHGKGALFPSAFDVPLTAQTERTDDRYGALWSVTHQRGQHTIKFGGELSSLVLDERFTFAVTDVDEAEEADLSEAALEHDLDNPFLFSDRQRPWMLSFFAQDAFRASDRLTLNFGARIDRSRLLIDAWQVSPRAGMAFAARPGTTLRASVMRLFQPPQVEYLLLSSSEEARELSPFEDEAIGGGSSIPPERQTAIDVSVSQDLGSTWRLDGTGWFRRGKDVGDPNVFVGTTIVFPNSVARQHAAGFDAALVMMPRRGWSGSASYTYARVEQYGPVTGGLFLEDEVAEIQDGTKFTPDHDQRHGVFATATYNDSARGWRISGAFRYQTGTPIGIDGDDGDDEVIDGPGAETVDFESGRVKPRTVVDLQAEWAAKRSARADVFVTGWINNVFNDTYAFNFGNPFSGTHYGAGRRVGVGVRVALK
jgi:hypothetical protein